MMNYIKLFLFLITAVILTISCAVKDNLKKSNTRNTAVFWLTKKDASVLLEKQKQVLHFDTNPNNYQTIEIDENQIFQTIDGFGFTLTGGSSEVINGLSPSKKQALLQELFGFNEGGIAISYLRLSIGASDLNHNPFSYNDLPTGATDLSLSKFNFSEDANSLIPLLKEILAINPKIKIIATPWSAPVWMKDNGSFIGGSLQPKYYGVYAQYFVKYIQEMKLKGITIDAITPQNEPLNPNNNPSLVMTDLQQLDFIKNHLGPIFKKENIETKIVVYDHNCNKPEYPLTILSDKEANAFIDGTAFHLYEGTIDALNKVHDSFPDKAVYFTEQYTSKDGSFEGDFQWHIKNVIIGSMRNWSKNALEWNLANNPNFGPNTIGGCTTCKGALTIDGDVIQRNVGYYIVAHASKFIPTGSVRISSNTINNLQNVAFKTPKGTKILIVLNEGKTTEIFNIKINKKWITATLDSGSVATFVIN